MRGFKKLPKSYFDKYSGKPVKIIEFNPQSTIVANKYIEELRILLKEFNVDIVHRGSTAFGIAGKGEIEVGIYPEKKDWDSIINKLKLHFGEIGNLEENYARFNHIFNNFEIEIILMKGHNVILDKKLTEYLKKITRSIKRI